MDHDGIFTSDIMLKLTDGLKEGLGLYISYCAAYLNDGNAVLGRIC